MSGRDGAGPRYYVPSVELWEEVDPPGRGRVEGPAGGAATSASFPAERLRPRPVLSRIEKWVSRHISQEVCPWNGPKLVRLTGERDYHGDWRKAADRPDAPAELPGTESPSLIELMRMMYDEWDLWTRGSAIRRAGYAGFKRNVAVGLGNWLASVDEPPEEAVAVLRDALDDEDPLVREHAAWALGCANTP